MEVTEGLHRPPSLLELCHRQQPQRGRMVGLFDEVILSNSALDRLANARYHIAMEGTGYRERLSPHKRRN